jgi:hypothetical protein
VNFAQIQRKIDHGLGIAARHLGQPYSVYRCESASSGDFPSGWTELTMGFPVYRLRRAGSRLEVAISNSALLYDIFADMGDYLLGDVFVCTDAAFQNGVSYGPGATSVTGTLELNAFSLAWHMPAFGDFKAGPNTGARLTHLARIFRPSTSPKTVNDGSQYWKSTHDNDSALTLMSGAFSFAAAPATGSIVPVGFGSAFRPSGEKPFSPSVPGMLPPARYYCYVPPLPGPGYEPREGDAIITIDNQRYVVIEPYRQETGVSGAQMLCYRFSSQAG